MDWAPVTSRRHQQRIVIHPILFASSFNFHACESWTLTAELQRRIQAMEMKCYRRILHISYTDHVSIKEVHVKVQQATGPHKDLLTMVKRCKLQWYGHVSCSSGLAKTILQGTVKEGRRQGRQKKRWEDNTREWAGLEFGKFQRAVKNRENGESWLQSHLWCPNDPRGYGIDEDADDHYNNYYYYNCCCRYYWLLPQKLMKRIPRESKGIIFISTRLCQMRFEMECSCQTKTDYPTKLQKDLPPR